MVTITVNALPEDTWREHVTQHPDGNVFHTPEMFHVFARAQGYQPSLWAAVDGHLQVLALLPTVQIALRGRLLRRLTTRAIAYGSVLCAPSPPGQEALATLLCAYNREAKGRFLFTELRNQCDLSCVQPVLQGNAFTYEEHLNFLVDIGLPVDKVWSNIHESARKKIRKALNKNQLKIVEACTYSQVDTCYDILQKTYANAGVPLADRSLLEAAFDILRPKGMVKFLLGQVEDTFVAASVALLYKDMIYGWYRGFDRAYSTCLPNDLMVWYILKWGAENGYRMFNFGGAGKPNEHYGPREFKAKFGGRMVNYGRNICVHAPIRLSLSKVGYRLMRRFL